MRHTTESPPRSAHGTPPRAIWGPSSGDVLSYRNPRRGGRDWLLLPDTFGSRAAGVLRVLAVLAILGAIVLAAFGGDEYERATERLNLPFIDVPKIGWNRREFVEERRQVALDRLRASGWLAGAAVVTLAGGGLYEWRRRRRQRQ